MAKCKHGVDHSGFNECSECMDAFMEDYNSPSEKFNRAWDKLEKKKQTQERKKKRNHKLNQ